MGTLRTKEAEVIYRKHIADGGLTSGCIICKREALKDFSEWKIIKNNFPYDKIAVVHDMLVPKRHVDKLGLTESEKKEYNNIKSNYVAENYEWMFEPVPKKKSIPQHFHLHIIVPED